MALPKFTVTGTIYDVYGHTNGGELEPVQYGKELWTRAKVTFTPNVQRGQFVVFEDALYYLRPVEAEIMPDGTIKHEGGDVTLVANDPGLSVENLQYRVEIQGAGAFAISALNDGETLDLKEVLPVTFVNATIITRGERGYPIDDVQLDGSDLVFYIQGGEVGRTPLDSWIEDGVILTIDGIDGGSPSDPGDFVLDGGAP